MAIPKTEASAGLRLRFAENALLLRDRAGLSQTMAAERADLHISHTACSSAACACRSWTRSSSWPAPSRQSPANC